MSTSDQSIPKIKLMLLITKGYWGGAQHYVYDLASNLPSGKYEVTVVTGEGEELDNKLRDSGIRVIKLSNLKRDIGLFNEWQTFLSLIKLFRTEKPDIIHLNSSKIGGLGALAGRLIGIKKIIFTAHGWAFNEQRSVFSRAIILFFHWLTIVLAHTTITVSHIQKNQIKFLPFIQTKLTTIHNGITSGELMTKAEARTLIEQKFPTVKAFIQPETIWLGTVAELHTNKGLDIAIRAIKNMAPKNFVYLIIGEGEKRVKLEKLIQQLNLTDKVFLIGKIPEAQKILPAFDIFLLPSRTEAFPYVLLEAGIASLPVITSHVGGIPEIITDQKSGLLVIKENETKLQEAIEKLIGDSTLRDTYGQELHHYVIKKFSTEQMLYATEKLYQN